MQVSLIPVSRFDDFITRNNLTQHKDAISLGRWEMSKGEYWVQLPRWLNTAYSDPHMKVVYSACEAKSIELEFKWELRSYQVKPMQKLQEDYQTTGHLGGVIQARPGAGKTVMAAYVSTFIKKKTLVVLDNSTLISQWEEAYMQATTCKSLGKIQGEVFDIEHDVVIAMVQTLMNRARSGDTDFFDKFRCAGFGIVFFDECHKAAAAQEYAKSTILMNRIQNIIGLTATPPVQNSTHDFLLNFNIGPTICMMQGQEEKPTLHYLHYRSKLTNKQAASVKRLHDGFVTVSNVVKGDYVKAVAKYNSLIADDPKYLEMVGRIANYLVDKEKHRLIIIVSTIKQIENICTYIKATYPHLSPTPFHAAKPNIDQQNDNLIVATAKKASAGFDYKELSALLIATPLKGQTSLIQTGGRILRACTGKQQPVIYDLIDYSVKCIGPVAYHKKRSVFMKEYGMLEVKDHMDRLSLLASDTMPE